MGTKDRYFDYRSLLGHVFILILICLLPFFVSDFVKILAVEAILLAVFALSLDLIMGHAGIVSFGHATFFGAGGYTLGMVIIHWVPSIWLSLILATLICGILALFIGVVSIRAKGIYFAILTLAFGEVIYRVVFHTYALGGSDGLIGIPVPDLNLFGLIQIDLKKPIHFYYLAVIFAYLAYLVSRRLMTSPFGQVLQGIRDNEDRVSFIGFNVRKYKIIAFVISGILAGMSGALFSLFKTFADTEQLHFLLSGKVIIMNLIGGMGTLIGPMIGAVFLTVFETVISSYFTAHQLITGAIFVLVVIFMPKGFYGFFASFVNGVRLCFSRFKR